MGRLTWFSQILCLSFMLLQFPVQSSSPSQSSLVSSPHLCLPEERSALLDFKSTTNLVRCYFGCPRPITQTWNESKDCCLWEGITCDKMKGHVIGLDLSRNYFEANLTTNSSLFRLEKLQSLNLCLNFFHYPNIPFGFDRWKSLKYLNLSNSIYMDDYSPFDEIFLLPKLVSLDLSRSFGLLLDNTKFQFLVHNLTELRFLFLDFVNMSLVVPSSLNLTSSLEHLSLRGCNLQGNFPSQVFQLMKLVSLDLSHNDLFLDNINFQMLVHNLTELRFLILNFVNMSAVVPSSLLNLTSFLEYLSLRNCLLQGNFPSQVFQLPFLRLIDLSHNYCLRGNLLESNWSSALKYLYLKRTSFSGGLSHSIKNFKLLEELDLYGCQFYGSISKSLANVTEITYLDFSSNLLEGQIPDVIGKMHKLTYLNFSNNSFGGEIPASISNLTYLTFLSLSSNKLLGHVPSGLFFLPSLSYLHLQNNRFTGYIGHVKMPNLNLQEVYLSNNEISGSIPSSFFHLVNLAIVDLSSNNLSGTITANMLSKLVHLQVLALSNNGLLSLSNNGASVNYSFPNLQFLIFSSCNIQQFPSFLRKAERLIILNISKNKISGQIHKWEIEGMRLVKLNLSYNFLTGIDSFGFEDLATVDLRSNLLQGSLPILTATLNASIVELLISGNNLTSGIPSAYCNLTYLAILDLANNSLGGKLPECLGGSSSLFVLDLRLNRFHGIIPNSFVNGSALRTLNLNGNQLEGRLPSSLVNCNDLEVLDVGNNYLNDTFPHWLGVLPLLKVIILQSNQFHGAINNSMPAFHFSELRVIDVSQNDFTGLLPSNYFKNLTGKRDVNEDEANLEYIGIHAIRLLSQMNYDDSVRIIMKGLQMELKRILTTFSTIDFSSNRFHGHIPKELGELNSLHLLNLSHNSLTGQIPSSLGKMTELESLDLSSNKLDGRIPEELTSLTFLSLLNLSHNKLEGDIPQGKQFNTFSNDSYIENSGLCGFPLTKKCHEEEEPGAPPSKFGEEDDSAALFEWKFALAGYGCGLVLGLSLGYIVFTTGKPWWLVKKVEKYQQKFIRRCTRRQKKRKTQKPNQHS